MLIKILGVLVLSIIFFCQVQCRRLSRFPMTTRQCWRTSTLPFGRRCGAAAFASSALSSPLPPSCSPLPSSTHQTRRHARDRVARCLTPTATLQRWCAAAKEASRSTRLRSRRMYDQRIRRLRNRRAACRLQWKHRGRTLHVGKTIGIRVVRRILRLILHRGGQIDECAASRELQQRRAPLLACI